MKNIIKIIVCILVLGLIAGGIAVLAKTDLSTVVPSIPGTDEQPDDSGIVDNGQPMLVYNNKEYTMGMALPAEVVKFEVRNLANYTVNIVPGSVGFDFRKNGNLERFPVNISGDWNKAFDLKVENGYFTFDNERKNMLSILEEAFPNDEITELSNMNKLAAYFKVEVTSGSTVIEVPITGFYPIMDITLSDTSIVF